MGITARSGPNLSYGVATGGSTDGISGQAADYNDQRGPDVSDLGYAMLDPRAAYNYDVAADVLTKTYAFYGSRGYVDYTPTAASTISVASVTASSSLASASLTLQAASSARGTYSLNIIAPETGLTVSSVLTFDSSAYTLQTNAFGTSGSINTWAPGWGAGRCISVQTASYSDSPVTVVGRDIYGYKLTESILISSNGSLTSSFGGVGGKAFKFVTAVFNSSAPTSTGIAVGMSDRYGFPFYTPYYGHDITVRVSSIGAIQNGAATLSTANAVIALASTATATSTTADVRGIYISSVAVGGTYRLQMAITPAASAVVTVGTTNVAPLFGTVQNSSL